MKELLLFLLACLCSCSKYKANEGASKKDFMLTLHDTLGVRANGVNSITVRLTSTKTTKDGLRVVFSTNKGTILQADQPFTGYAAETRLLLAEDTGIYVIKAVIKEGTVEKVEKTLTASFRPAYELQDYILTVIDTMNVRLNGSSQIGVQFTGVLAQKQGLTVHFESTKGTLLQTDLPYTSNIAQTRLTVGQDTGTYFLKTQLKDGADVKVEKTISFRFRKAFAEAINLELNRPTWIANQPVVIKTYLSRRNGSVTVGQPVFFTAHQENNAGQLIPIGRFEGLFNNVSNLQGQLSDVKLFTDTPGIESSKPVRLEAKALNDQGDTIRHVIIIPNS